MTDSKALVKSERMKDAYTTSMKVFEQVARQRDPSLIDQLDSIKQGELYVVRGQYDHIETILDTMQLPYTMLSREQVRAGEHKDGRVLLVNCMDYSNGAPVKEVREFVEEGGRLVTTDWALGLVSKAFPDHVHKTNTTSDDVVEVRCTGMGAKLIGLHYVECHPKWWLEGSSHVYSATDKVTPLITSDEMAQKYGEPYVAVGFKEGKGEVLHFISHFELQRTHQRTDSDRKGLDDFLKNMKATKTAGMANVNVAELEAAYSTLNTLAHLCAKSPVLMDGNRSVLRR